MAIRAPDGAKSREFSGIAKLPPGRAAFSHLVSPMWTLENLYEGQNMFGFYRDYFCAVFFNENFFSIAVLEKNFTFIPSTSDKNPLTELKDLVCVPLFHGIECFWE